MSAIAPAMFALWTVAGAAYYVSIAVATIRAGHLIEGWLAGVLMAMLSMLVGLTGLLLTAGPLLHRVAA